MNDRTGEIREMTPDMAGELNRLSHMAGDEQCRCEGAIAEHKAFFDQIIDRRQHVEIICLTCQSVRAGSVYSLGANTMRLYWQEETEVYQNACPDCHTAYTLQAQPYDGEA